MTRLRKLTARAFRGARFELILDTSDKFSSIAVYGDNATGKSTIADALEWLLLGTVDHLWREGCKEDALRNILATPSELSEVEAEFEKSILFKKTLNAALETKAALTSKDLASLLKTFQGERIFLRHSQITKFIDKTKGEKKEEIAAIIGYQQILDFREAIQGARSQLAKDSDFISARDRAESASERLLKRSGSMIASRSQLYTFVSKHLEQFGASKTIATAQDYSDAIDTLKGRITDPDRAQRKLRLASLRADCDAFQAKTNEIVGLLATFLQQYALFAENKDAAAKIKIEHFLSLGRSLIQNDELSENACPFCLKESDLVELEKEVDARIAESLALKNQFDSAKSSLSQLQKLITDTSNICIRIAENCEGTDALEQLTKSTGPTLSALSSLGAELQKKFIVVEPISSLAGQIGALKHFATLSKSHSNHIDATIEALKISAEESKLVDAIDLLRDLATQIGILEASQSTKRAFENQIFSLSSILERFQITQNDALQVVLDRISKDVGHFYGKLHPAENVDKIRLRVVGENGIEFEYEFHGIAAQPPLKYLSESHLNSLGICLFLASAKLFNESCRLLVLDDIVTSFDINHRRRILRLLKEEFADWQIVLLTHEHLWFDVIKKEMAQENWQFKEVEWDSENGIRLNESAASLRKFIDEKRKKHDVSNDVRKLIESIAKELCYALEVRLSFKFNDTNERRMSGELLSALRATVNRKSSALKDNPIFQQIEGSSLVANVGSHDNPSETVAPGDIDVALSDIDKLIALFSCQHCKRLVEASRPISGKNKISCKCGKTELDWKD